jgi:purine nucleoside permease
MIVSMFKPEADVWVEPLALRDEIPVPGLADDYPTVRCNPADICQVTTGMGHANAAASMMAVLFSRRFDLTHTYFLIAGIAGIDPNEGTIGSAAWARYLVDVGLTHEIDAREMPKGWESGYFGIETDGPQVKPSFDYRTELFHLDDGLVEWAMSLSAPARLDDNDRARAYRSHYRQNAARQAPIVLQCDTAAGDTYWHGEALGRQAERWMALLTDGKGRYCTTQQEDNATLAALTRGAGAGLVDLRRIAVLRTGANFDRPYPGQSAHDSLRSDSGGFPLAVSNLVNAGKPLVDEITVHWDLWQIGIPKR